MTIVKNFLGNFERGMFIYQSLYNTGLGVVVAVDSKSNQGDCHTFSGGIGAMGGGDVHVVFMNGHESKNMSEALLRGGIQYGVSEYHLIKGLRATENEIAQLLANAEQKRIDDAAEEAAEQKAFAEATEAVAADEAYSHLTKLNERYASMAEVAKNIRKDLKHNFPGFKFSVRSSRHGAVNVSWTDGATEEEVKAVLGKYKTGTFDAYTDYHGSQASPFTDVYGGVDYLFYDRDYSDEFITEGCEHAQERFNCDGIEVTAERYSKGALFTEFPKGCEGLDIQKIVREYMWKTSKYTKPAPKAAKAAKAASEAEPAQSKAADTSAPATVNSAVKAELDSIIEMTHTKKGFDIFVVPMADRVSKDIFTALLAVAKTLKGWFNGYTQNGAVAGFTFKSREQAKAFYDACHA